MPRTIRKGGGRQSTQRVESGREAESARSFSTPRRNAGAPLWVSKDLEFLTVQGHLPTRGSAWDAPAVSAFLGPVLSSTPMLQAQSQGLIRSRAGDGEEGKMMTSAIAH